MAARITLSPGDVFAGYAIQQVLGEGGMGTVYLAQHPRLPRSVALKLLHRDLTGDNYVRSRFELEADHAARLEHPNIVTVHDRGREDDQLWIAMQYVDSTDAGDAIINGPLEPAHAVHIITETARALDYAHSHGVLHRDVKPANILLEKPRPGLPGRVLLADFGIAKALAETAHLTQTGMLVLSLHYASPEQFDDITLDARSDVYSLGCTFFHLLTGHFPYSGNTLPQLWAGHVNGEIPRPSRSRPALPPTLDAVFVRAMAKDREDRYSACGELAAAATDALGSSARAGPTEAAHIGLVDPAPGRTMRPPVKSKPHAAPARDQPPAPRVTHSPGQKFGPAVERNRDRDDAEMLRLDRRRRRPPITKRRLRWTIIGTILAVSLIIGLVVANTMIRNNYYVRPESGEIAILRGIPWSVLGYSFEEVYEYGCVDNKTRKLSFVRSDQAHSSCATLKLSDLNPRDQELVRSGLPSGSLKDAEAQLNRLASQLK